MIDKPKKPGKRNSAEAVRCPTCGKAMSPEKETELTPFCSNRCRLVDLGRWFDEKHRLK